LPVTGKEIGGGRVNAARAILGIPPEIVEIEDKTVNVGEEVMFIVKADDVDDDNDNLVLSARLDSGDSLSSIGATFEDNGDGTGNFSYTAEDSFAGTAIPFMFEVKDPQGLEDEETVLVTINKKRRRRRAARPPR